MLAAVLMLLAPAGAPDDADPLAPARAGELLCIQPDTTAKTCLAIANYSFAADGTITNTLKTMINPMPLITMQTVSNPQVEDGAICAVIKTETFDAAVIEMDGAAASPEVDAAIRPKLQAAVAPLAGKKACQKIHPDGDHLTSDVTMDGVAQPDRTRTVLWIKPDEGYRVGS